MYMEDSLQIQAHAVPDVRQGLLMPRSGLPGAPSDEWLRIRLEREAAEQPDCQTGCAVLMASLVDVDAECP